MYCYTYINQFPCIFNELQLWAGISSEHPSFLNTVATLSKIKLPKAMEDKLRDFASKSKFVANYGKPRFYRQYE